MVLSPTVTAWRAASGHERAAVATRAQAVSAPAAAEARMQALYDAHARPLYRYLLTLTFGDRQSAEDLLQETMMRAWRNIDGLHPDVARLRPWLFTVARNLAIDAGRARKARPQEVTDVDITGLAQVDDPIDRMLAVQMIKQAMASLSPEHHSVIIEIHFRGRSTSEAARLLGIPEGTVKSRTYHALRALRSALHARGESAEGLALVQRHVAGSGPETVKRTWSRPEDQASPGRRRNTATAERNVYPAPDASPGRTGTFAW
jgi:RNA polymerase sigma-70 factor, ECF subfamily